VPHRYADILQKVRKKINVHYFATVKQMAVLRTVFCTAVFIQVVAMIWIFFFNPSKCCDDFICVHHCSNIKKTMQFADILTFIDLHVS
jgi:type IV secretory pathway component VirB8